MTSLPNHEAVKAGDGESRCRLSGPNWFTVTLDGDAAQVSILNDIGAFGQTALDVLAQVQAAKTITLAINSTGGDMSCALAVFDGLADRVAEALITGSCFSSAVILAAAAKEIQIEAGARMMVHPARRFVFGDEAELTGAAQSIAKFNARLRAVLAARTGQPAAVLEGWLDGRDHYFTAQEAVAAGLADEVFSAPVSVCFQTHGNRLKAAQDSPTADEALFNDFLRAFGRVHVRNRQRFTRDLCAWAVHNTIQDAD